MIDFEKLKSFKNSGKVLYAEDDENVRQSFVKILRQFFNDIDEAADGEEAYDLFRHNRYDLVITDLNMPKSGGIELIRKIREMDGEQKIMVVSAYSDSDRLLELINENILHFIQKPIDINAVVTAIEKVQLSKGASRGATADEKILIAHSDIFSSNEIALSKLEDADRN